MVEATSHAAADAAPRHKRRRWPYVLGGIVAVIAVVAILFRWDWLLPFVESRASAALGRQVTAVHMHVQLGRVTRITFDDVHIANPAGWPGGGDFASAAHLAVAVNAETLIRTRQVVIPAIALDHPVVDAEQKEDGTSNWTFNTGSSGKSSGSSIPKIGDVAITDGTVHFVDPKLKSDFQLAVNTEPQPGAELKLHATAKGTYAGQPIAGTFTGGALLSLRDKTDPYPVGLHLANGPTRVDLTGTVQDPLSFEGADLKLALKGPDMKLLYPLTGIPLPETPPYTVEGNLDYQAGHVRFTNFKGTVGKSDLAGDIAVTTTGKPVVDATLASREVDLSDLGAFIGGTPAKAGDKDETAAQRAEAARARASSKALPDTPLNLPKLNAADVHLHYKAERILGRGQPLDDMVADLDVVDGAVKLHPLSFGIGGGKIASQIALNEEKAGLHARADVDFDHIPVDKLLSAAGVGRGAGAISGRGVIEGIGRSLAAILGHADGEVKLYMGRGGDLSALLVDLSGLEFGNALLSALGLPRRATIECLIADAKLRDGIVRPDPLVLDTNEATTYVSGDVNLMDEALRLQLKTKPKHFTIGSLPAPVNVGGTFKAPTVGPDVGAMAARAGAAVALGVVLTPLAALLPTIQFGTGETNTCSALPRVESAPHVPPREASHEAVRRAPVRRR
jgi:uncharacterized protein involved in outer membrane biogenesis